MKLTWQEAVLGATALLSAAVALAYFPVKDRIAAEKLELWNAGYRYGMAECESNPVTHSVEIEDGIVVNVEVIPFLVGDSDVPEHFVVRVSRLVAPDQKGGSD